MYNEIAFIASHPDPDKSYSHSNVLKTDTFPSKYIPACSLAVIVEYSGELLRSRPSQQMSYLSVLKWGVE